GIQGMTAFIAEGQVQDVLSSLIKTMDIFLAALVMIFLAVGLYELFSAGARETEAEACQSWGDFSSTLDQLKSSLTKLVIIILIITFLELVLAAVSELSGYQLLILPAGIYLIAWSLRLIKG
ncbi:MAG: YqhA family protein, partial [Proteobacteria bacterium]|nr:YqhA family protein [Pseudomonadota bacterium]